MRYAKPGACAGERSRRGWLGGTGLSLRGGSLQGLLPSRSSPTSQQCPGGRRTQLPVRTDRTRRSRRQRQQCSRAESWNSPPLCSNAAVQQQVCRAGAPVRNLSDNRPTPREIPRRRHPRRNQIFNTVRKTGGLRRGKVSQGVAWRGAASPEEAVPSKVFPPQSPLPHPARFARRQSPSTSADAAMAGIHQNFFIFFSFPFFVRAIRIYAIRVVRNCLRDFRFSGRRSGYRASACAWRTAW